MIFIDKMKNMKIYKTPTFLPTVDGNKKKGSAAVLLTPNYNSSKKLMNNPMFVNKLRFQSYYLQKDVSYFVNSKVTEEVPFSEGYSEYEYLVEMTAAEKNKLKDTDFGLPGERKYPMPDAAHVKSAIKFFNYVDKDKEAELAKNIKAKAKKFGVTISVGKTNRLAKYVTEAEIANESIYNNPVPVFFFKNISPDNILEAYKAVAKSLPAKVACKVHSGEFGNNNFLRPALWKPLIEYLDGTVVECNTAYEGSRNTTEEHKKTLAKHGWDKLPCEIMDEHGEVELDIPKYNQMNKNYVGAGLLDFNSLVVLSHFKGHTMGGFGGALKQLSIGCASSRGKKIIHGFGDEKLGMDMLNSHTGKDEDINYDDQIKFTEAMADAASSVHEKFKDNVVYINVLANISKDCDCDAHAAAPSMKDIGILVSTDPVAIDKASIDLIYKSDDPGKDEIIDRIESREGLHIFDACKAIDFGTTDYRLIDLSMLRNVEKNTEKRIDEEEVEERFRYIPEWIAESSKIKCPKCGSSDINTILCADPQYKCNECNHTWGVPFNESQEKLTDGMVFDLGGVLLKGLDWKEEIKKQYDYPDDVIDKVIKTHLDNFDESDTATIEDARFAFCSRFDESEREVAGNCYDVILRSWEPFDYVDDVIKLCKKISNHLYYLSNWSRSGFETLQNNGKLDFLKEFDGGLVSYEVGFQKPDESIYKLFIEKMNIEDPANCIFFDDKEENVQAARSAGLSGVVFTSIGDIKTVDDIQNKVRPFGYVEEGYIKSEEDIYYNKDKFDSGEINLCFILGHSGSGKTTMALDHTKGNEDKVDMYCLDDLFCIKDHFTMANLKEYGDLIYQFFNGPGKKYYITWEELKDSNIPGSEYEDKLYPEFVNFAKSYAKSHKDKKYIIEGVWLMEHGENKQPYFQPEEFKNYAFYIKGTSMLTSKFRAAKRDVQDIEDKSRSEIIKDFSKIFFKKWKFYTTDEKSLKKFRDYFSKLTPVNEAYDNVTTDYNLSRFGNVNMIIVGEMHNRKMIEVWDNLLTKFKPEYWICEFADMDECLDDEILKDRMEHVTNGSYDGKGADYQYNYWVYELALKHHVKLIGCNPIGKKFKTLEDEFKFRESYMLNTIKKYDKKRCLVQLGDGHLRGIPWSKELQDFSGNYKDDRGIVSDITVSFASPIWEYYHNRSGVKIIRWKHDYDIEKEFQSLNEKKKFINYYGKLTSINEHVTKKDEDYRSKGTIDLSELRPIEVTEGIIQKYQDEYKFLKHIRTGENCKARMFKRQHGDQILCGVCVEEKQDGTKWIQALEVFYEFREYGLGRQLLDYAVTKLGAEYLSVSKKNEVAIQMYEDYGFKRYKETQVMYFYTLDPNCEVEDSVTTEQILAESGDWFSTGDKIMFFGEDAKYDMQLKKMLYNDRIRQRKQLLELYAKVKTENPFIKYTFPDLSKYTGKNVFFDTCYYTELFFRNNTWALQKGLRLFEDYMQRLMGNTIISTLSYKKITVFIPILDWFKGGDQIWNYRKSLNPISLIYQYMLTGNLNGLKKIFSDKDIIFVGDNKYFKINFSSMDTKDLKKLAMKFKIFVTKICLGQDFEAEDIDTTADNVESPEVIKAQIVDKIEDAKGVDLTAKVAAATARRKDNMNGKFITKATIKKDVEAQKDIDNPDPDEVISKATLNQPKNSDDAKRQFELDRLSDGIEGISNRASTLDDALDQLDKDEDLKRAIIDLDNSTPTGTINITAARSARITELDRKLLATELNGKSIKDILDTKPQELPKTELPIASPNAEQWKNLSFVNFDKNYNIDKDIIRCFRFFENVSRPISIRSISAEDTSTSEDRIKTYTLDLEDYKAKRFHIKLDIPIMKDNRFLLRGNGKTIQTQFFNMPILKVDEDVAEIISNYMKIRVIKYNTNTGKSLPIVARFLKAINKYTGRTIKVTYGDNTMICKKYDLPMDYIDLASVLTKIETPRYIIYFSQDEIREKYKDQCIMDHQYPIYYNKKNKVVCSWDGTYTNITDLVLSLIIEDDPSFKELFNSTMRPTSCTYTKCKIMNAEIPTIVICAYHEGLRKTLDKAGITYEIKDKLEKHDRANPNKDWIKFNDGYVVYYCNYSGSILMNGLKVCPTEDYSIADIDNRDMYLGFLDDFGGRIKADGLDNFYDCMIDPMTKDVLEFYKLPTDYVTILIYASNLLVDNKFHKHTDTSTRRLRRYELIASYTYKVLSDAYSKFANECKHGRNGDMVVKQSAVIDKFLSDTITSDDSCINALRDIETTNAITTKGPSGMNKDRAYSLDKRTYDDSMLNVLGMSTGFASNVGITRQATLNANIEGEKGFVKNINGDTSKMNTVSSLTAIESLIPFGTTHDDPMRTAMSFVQTAKHQVRTEESDPPLVVNGSEEAMPYISTDRFAYKAKAQGKVIEFDPEKYIILEYADGTNDYINLKETIEKNSDGGYYVPLKLDAKENVKVGMRVKEGDILAYDKYSYSNTVGESGNLAYNVGKLAKVAIINTDEGFEDSGVITEKMARSLATRVILKFDVILDKDTRIISNMKVGDHVEAGQALMVWQNPFEEEDANQLINTLSTTSAEVSELGKRRLTSEVTGTVTGIKMFRTVDTKDLTPSLKKMVDAYEKPIKEMADKVNSLKGVDKSIVDSHTTLSTIGKLKKAEDSVLVEYYVEYLDTVGIGDKIVYFAANKATEKSIIPLGKEPRSSFRPNETVDAFVSEVSIDKRIVTSTLLNGALNKLMIELDRSVKDILGIPYDDSKI